jgi:hypothetical protein
MTTKKYTVPGASSPSPSKVILVPSYSIDISKHVMNQAKTELGIYNF